MVRSMRQRGIYKWRIAFAAALLQLLVSCGIFTPRDSEAPEPGVMIDPFNFAAILENTNENFTSLRYEDLFMESDTVYLDVNYGRSSTTALLQRLHQILIQYPRIQVQWTTGTVWKNSGNDTMVLSGLKYYIFSDSTTGGPPGDSGSSNFTAVIYNRNWVVSLWTDIPSRAGRSFFDL
ncbi:MAG: hypothetical protein JW699_06040 [Chitinispirillaceae bacterium]|nr:hypothetical protein [Chitinispirillaceae bacterium]